MTLDKLIEVLQALDVKGDTPVMLYDAQDDDEEVQDVHIEESDYGIPGVYSTKKIVRITY